MRNKLLPSLLLPELFFPQAFNESNALNIMQKAIEFDFYKVFELAVILDKSIAGKIRRTAEENDLKLVQWMTFELLKHNLNLASVDKALRQKSVDYAKKLVHLAAESGATKLSLVSGAKPQADLEAEAKKCLADSLIRISEEMKQFDRMILQIEPLDCFAHKKQIIGLTGETVDWIQSFRKECDNLYIAWDSAHVRLNREELTDSLKIAAPLLSQLHLSNAVLDPTDPLYGDFHMKLGAPGFMTENCAISILETVHHLDIPPPVDYISVAVEVRTSDEDDLWEHEKYCRHFLKSALAQSACYE